VAGRSAGDRKVLDELADRADAAALLRDRGGRQVVGDVDAAVPVFSVTKMFVAVATLRLAESGHLGHLGLDAQVRQWVPQIASPITVREILGHTAGLPDYIATGAYLAAVASGPGEPWDLAEILKVSLTAEHSPRGEFRYANVGYWLLGAVIERVTGVPLAGTLAAEVFRPAEMTATFYPEIGAGVTGDGYDTRWAGPAGAAWSTAPDVDRFLAALLGGALVGTGSLAAMTSATPAGVHPPWREPGYGLGLMVDGVLGILGHGGGGPGYQAAAFTAPGAGRSAVILARSPSPPSPSQSPSSVRTSPTELALRWLVV
jgi:CubicO group peptidase (beta-lactamase class C family)